MRRILDIRIVRWELKLAYVVGAYLVGLAIATMLRALGTAEATIALVSFCVDLVAILLGARVFRGRGEPIEPARTWWRMTARPKLSWRLGILFLVLSVGSATRLVLLAIGAWPVGPTGADGDILGIAVLVEYGLIAFLYLNSAIRLRRLGVPPPEPKFRPTVRIKP
ncbi:hypothetical protein [Agromyces sp. Soil535]|uniref:hypothetical protein n=1 Tax=Agromyces sp. Soil535 TaxID=1736390 RepID=UPI0006F60CF7|nr:hypothetical protein [Agromyces sp. Soil535]KRE29062.1 hypothetical protein ASG80_20165 [Agromyces sp. Soil535]